MNFRKIGIITITRDQNFGNQLQNYAVQEVFKRLGFFPETIINSTKSGLNYRSPFLEKLTPVHMFLYIKCKIEKKLFIKNDRDSILKSIYWSIKNKECIIKAIEKRKEKFRDFFRTYIKCSEFTINVDIIDNDNIHKYEYFVCGSDQIWNPYYSQTSMIDFLSFSPKAKRIAYSPSFGVNHIPPKFINQYKKWINEIPNLSVREEQGAIIIKELTGRKPTVLVDPTLMLSKEEWLAISKKPDICLEEKYLLTYFLGNETTVYRKEINRLAEKFSYKIINLADIHEIESYTFGPREFIYLISKAALVCTDSFHGAIFSIIMRTNFVVFDRAGNGHSMGSRLENLLEKFGLEERLFKGSDISKEAFETNFNNTELVIKFEQNKTWNYLREATGQ